MKQARNALKVWQNNQIVTACYTKGFYFEITMNQKLTMIGLIRPAPVNCLIEIVKLWAFIPNENKNLSFLLFKWHISLK